MDEVCSLDLEQQLEALKKENAALRLKYEININELKATAASLKEKEERMVSLQYFLEEVVYRAELNGLLLDLSPSIYKVSGYKAEELIGRNVLDYYAYPEQREAYIQALKAHGEVREFPITLRAKDGREINFSMNSRIVFDGNRPAYIEGAMTDQTERFRLLEELKQARDDALVASKAKSDFLAIMSHELRTPIHGLMGMLNFLAGETLSDAQQEYVSAALYSVKTLHDQVNNILDLSKVEAGMMSMHTVDFDVAECVYEALSSLRFQAKSKCLDLSCEWEHVPQMLRGDAVRLRQVLLNLMGNAIKFTHEGYVRLLIQQQGEHAVYFCVEDSGIGLSESELASVFEPFTQVDSSTTRLYQGTGLGTTIAQRLVKLMGGELCAKSVKGEGSCFYFTLPLQARTKQTVHGTWDMSVFRLYPGVGLDVSDVPHKLMARKRHVLVADDDPIGLKIMCKSLRRCGCEVTAATDGHAALELAMQHRYDLILLDMQMPYLDGAAVTRQIRAFEQTEHYPAVPIIGLSAHALDEVVEHCTQMGMTTFLTKPIQMDEVLRVLEKQC